jgi:hypothetical protein
MFGKTKSLHYKKGKGEKVVGAELLSAAEYQPAPRHQQRVFSALT